jgi:peptidoglycan/LPS O-acetylase OafA/YrhL
MNNRISNLDGLRFIAAFLVLITHIQVIKKFFNIEAFSSRLLSNSSHIAVTFFFVLSGFLIGYFLIREKTANGNISIGKFYKRRVLRIWPLYYLLLLLNFFVFPHLTLMDYPQSASNPVNIHFAGKLTGCLLFFPNYTSHIYESLGYMDITWSLAVEEFFYIFFPLLIFFTGIKHLRNILVLLLIVFTGLSLVPVFIDSIGGLTKMYIGKYRLYAFIAGALSAYFYFHAHKLPAYFQVLKNKKLSLFLLTTFFVLVFTGTTFSIVNHQLYSIFFAVLLFSISSSGIKPFIINNRAINYCGKISYGIYMLHPVAVILCIRLFNSFSYSPNNTMGLLVIDIAAILMTITVSVLSYECYEKLFLKKSKPAPTIAA